MSTHDHERRASDECDAALRARWRSASDEQPSSRIDAAIIDAARQSVAGPRETLARPRPTRWLSPWQSLAAAAGVAGLALVLVPMLPRHPAPTPTSGPTPEQREASTAAAPAELPLAPAYETAKSRSAPASALGAAASAEERGAPAPTGKLPESVAGNHGRTAAQAIPAPPDAAGTSLEDLAGGATTGAAPVFESAPAEHRNAARREASDRAAAGGLSAPSAARASSFDEAPAADPVAWAARIASLHAAGDFVRAEQELRAFRQASADADGQLPEALRDWARTVK